MKSETRFCVVLVETSHPGNIGACARAMKTMGITDLRLVNTVSERDEVAYRRSSGADDVIFRAKRCASLSDAVSDCQLVLGTSARLRSQVSPPLLVANQLPTYLSTVADSSRIALVFGNEQNGLDNEDLFICHAQIMVPTNPEFSSLNLASCVQIVTFLATQLLDANDRIKVKQVDKLTATHGQLHALTETLSEFAFRKNPQRFKQDHAKLMQLLFRIEMTADEVDFLHGIFNRIAK